MATSGRRVGEPVRYFDGQALRRLRRERGLTLDALGSRARASRASLIAYEHGSRRPGIHTVSALATALECSAADLVPEAGAGPDLADLRLRAGLTKTELAARLGVARVTWDQIERGTRRLRPERCADLARHLGIGVREARAAAGRAQQGAPVTARSARGRPEATASGFGTAPAPGRLEDQRVVDPFIGRCDQLLALRSLLSRSRLVTLTGVAGVGKTRLAVELARQVADRYEHGVWLVELAATSTPELVPQTVARAFGIRERAGLAHAETLSSRLRSSRLLLLLDNCEHLVDACAALVVRLIGECPGVSCLATSQRALGVDGEEVWAVPPMEVPAPGDAPEAVAASEVVRLFCESASSSRRGFALTPPVAPAVAEICRRLEGIPLAIRLAAARTSILNPSEILRRLEAPFSLLTGGSGAPRHQTLQNALDWSYRLLPTAERSLLRSLSVFAGGCDIEAIEALGADGPDGEAGVLDSLAGLVAKSLVMANTSGERSRYDLLEAVRQYAAERVAEAGETAALRRRHLGWCTELAEAAEMQLTGPDQVAWLWRLEAEHDNLRAALAWATAEGETGSALRLSGALTLFWRMRGYFREGRAWLESAIELAGAAEPAPLARALRGLGFLAFMVNDTGVAISNLERALELSRRGGDLQGQARSLLLLANARAINDPGGPTPMFEQSLELARQAGDRWCLGHALAMLARSRLHHGDEEQARRLLEECVEGARAFGELQSLRIGLYLLGTLARMRGEQAAAEALFAEGLAVTRQLGEPFDSAVALQSLGQLAMARGDDVLARRRLDEALLLARQAGDPATIGRGLSSLGAVVLRENEIDVAGALMSESLATLAEAGLPPDPSALQGLGEVARHRGEIAEARQLLERAVELARSRGDQATMARSIAALGEVSRQAGNLRRAHDQHRQALALRRELADQPGIAESLEALAGLAAAGGDRWDEAATLLGAAQSLRDIGGFARPPALEEIHLATWSAAEAALGPVRFGRASERGRAMSSAQAIAFAQRGRRPVSPPRVGWDSLTRAEGRVAALVVEGLTNAQIAERLFVTTSTVEGHVSNIFGKLGLESRAQLVREGVGRWPAGRT